MFRHDTMSSIPLYLCQRVFHFESIYDVKSHYEAGVYSASGSLMIHRLGLPQYTLPIFTLFILPSFHAGTTKYLARHTFARRYRL